MAEPKTRPTDVPVQTFIDQLEDPRRRADCEVLVGLMQEATGVAPVMWGPSIVGFGRYRQLYANGKTDEWPIIGFSPRKQDLTLYLMPGFSGMDALLATLGKHKTSKACLYLKRLSDVDLNVLKSLIQTSVAAMASQRTDL